MPRPERSFNTPALILKRRDFGEADRLLTVLTPNHGKLDVIAKGARKLTSRKMGHVELFTNADMLIHTGRELSVASQASMRDGFDGLREDLTRGALAAYCAELTDRFLSGGDGHDRRAYSLLLETFRRLSTEADVRLAVRYFELHLLDVAGFRPELAHCVISGEAIQPQDQHFSFTEGGVIAPGYVPSSRAGIVALPMLTLKLMRFMQRSAYEQVVAASVPQAVVDDVERVLSGYIAFLLERRPQSAEFVRRLRREDEKPVVSRASRPDDLPTATP
jgi:DNA repair protein RecO (recombination protein O)